MKSIYKWFARPNVNAELIWFTAKFDQDEFNGIDKMLFLYIRYCAELDIPASRRYIEPFMKTEGRKLMRLYNIKISEIENFDYNEPSALEEAFRVMLNAVYIAHDEYSSMPVQEDESFKAAMHLYFSDKKKERTIKIMSDAFPALSMGSCDVDRTIEDMQYQLDKISVLYDLKYLDKLDFLESRTTNGGEELMHKICSTGIPCIDGDTGGLYSSQVWAFTGGPGTGKTRFVTANFIYHALTVEKIDVLMYELELKAIEVKNMLIAIHILYLFGGQIKIPDKIMNQNNMTSEQRKYYEAAKMDLFESGKWGKFIISTDELYIESVKKDTLITIKRNKNIKLLVIDYAGLAASRPLTKYAPHLDQYEIIRELYKATKDVCKIADIGAVIVNQLNKEGVIASYAGKDIIPGHIEGGQIIERHSDYCLVMTMTNEQEVANRRSLSTVKTRAATGFKNVQLQTDLSVSIFRQLPMSA